MYNLRNLRIHKLNTKLNFECQKHNTMIELLKTNNLSLMDRLTIVSKKRFIHAIGLTVFQTSFKIHLKEDNRTVDKSKKRNCVYINSYIHHNVTMDNIKLYETIKQDIQNT